jgi:hypothetical protein
LIRDLRVTFGHGGAALSGCNRSRATSNAVGSRTRRFHAIPSAGVAADNGNWEMPGKDYASTRFSALNQITPANVASSARFTFSTATTHGYEAPPLVVGGTMYLITPFPNNLYALDLTKPGAPQKWVFKPKPLAASQGVACCDVVNRGAVYGRWQDLLQHARRADDRGRRQAASRSGAPKLGNIQKGETITMAPLVAKGKVLVGNSGGEMGVRGWLAALDEGSGKVAWKAYQHRSRQGRADRLAVQAVLRRPTAARTSASRPGRRSLEDRRRHRVGLDQLRSRRSASSITAPATPARGTRPAARRQQVDDRRLRARRQHRRGACGSTRRRRTTCSTTTTSTRSSSPTSVGRHAAPVLLRPGATASSTSWTAAPARCCRRRLTATSTDPRASTSRPAAHPVNPEKEPKQGASCATSARRARAEGLEPVGVQRRAPASSTSRTTTSAWTKAPRRTTSPARRTSAPT